MYTSFYFVILYTYIKCNIFVHSAGKNSWKVDYTPLSLLMRTHTPLHVYVILYTCRQCRRRSYSTATIPSWRDGVFVYKNLLLSIYFRFWPKRTTYWFYRDVYCFYFFFLFCVYTFWYTSLCPKILTSNSVDQKFYLVSISLIFSHYSLFSVVVFLGVRKNYQKTK